MRRGFSAAPRWVLLPAVLGALLILLPLVGLLLRIDWVHLEELLTSESSLAALSLSLRTAVVSTALCMVLGCPLALVLARSTARAVTVLRSLVLLPLVLPPVVGGIALLYTFGRTGLLGRPLAALGVDIAFSTAAVVLAQTFVALPFLVVSLEGALRTAGTRHEQVAAGLGASPTRTLFRVTLPLALPAVLSGAALSFARCLGEFGATLTFAGSLEGVTRTLPLEIYLQRETDPDAAVALSLLLVLVALLVVGLSTPARRRRGAGFRSNLTGWFERDRAEAPGDATHEVTGHGREERLGGDAPTGVAPGAESSPAGDPAPGGRPGTSLVAQADRGAAETRAPGEGADAGRPREGGVPRRPDDAPSSSSSAEVLTKDAHEVTGLRVAVAQEQRRVAAEFTVEPGETVALLGENGVGKSTVLG
ncbi:molybdate ABC transporter permease subunit, partial [Kocuria tytonicola]